MPKNKEIRSDYEKRYSRFVWQVGDVIVVKKGDEQPQADLDQTKGETPTINDQASDQTSGKDDESKKG